MEAQTMQKKFSVYFCASSLCVFTLLPILCFGQPQPAAGTAITVTGKVFVQQHGKSQWVVVHSKDAIAYLIKGDLVEKLKTIAAENNDRTILTLEGIPSGGANVSCDRSSSFEADAKGGKKMVIKVRCIRYNYLDVTAISSVVQSDEKIPEPQYDKAAEEKALKSDGNSNRNQGIVGEIYGKIRSCNIQSVPKTFEIQALDKTSSIKTLTVIITASTRIVKHIKDTEPSPLLPENLQIGQRVTVVYTRNEIRTEALFITVTKD
jgi:hypothetical protein